MRQAVDIDEALAIKLQKMAREAGSFDLEAGTTRTGKKPSRLATAVESISRGFSGDVRLEGSNQIVRAYARFGSVSQGEQFLISWTAGNEVDEDSDDPQRGQWDIIAFDASYMGVAFNSQGCACRDSKEGTGNHNCTICGCINKTLYLYPPRLRKLLSAPGSAPVDWPEASELRTLKYVGDCLWVSDWFPSPDCNADEYEEDSDEYRYELDLELRRLRLVRRPVEYPNCEELYAEWCLTTECGLRCNGPWHGELTKLTNIEQPDVCRICVTPVFALPTNPPCWFCPQQAPEAYEMTVPAEATYEYNPEGGGIAFEPLRCAGKTITFRRVGVCTGWVWLTDLIGQWTQEIGECDPLRGTSDPLAGEFWADFYAPAAGSCNLYKWEDSTTIAWLFVEMDEGSVYAEVTFVDTRSCRYSGVPASCPTGEPIQYSARYVIREGGVPSYEGQQSENWCLEEELQLRSRFFDIARTWTHPAIHWYDTYEDMQAQTGFPISESHFNEIFAVTDDGSLQHRTLFYRPFVSTVPGETVWTIVSEASLALASGVEEQGLLPARDVGIVTIRPTNLPRTNNTGQKGAVCSGEQTDAEECDPDATCRWEEAFTEPVGVTCELVGSPGEWVPDESEVATFVEAMAAALPATASEEYEVIVGTCDGPGGTTVRLRYLDKVIECPAGCSPCTDPGPIEGLTVLEVGCNPA